MLVTENLGHMIQEQLEEILQKKESTWFAWINFRKARVIHLLNDKLQIGDTSIPIEGISNVCVENQGWLQSLLNCKTITLSYTPNNGELSESFTIEEKSTQEVTDAIHAAVSGLIDLRLSGIEHYTSAAEKRKSLVYQPYAYIRHSVATRFAQQERPLFKINYIHTASLLKLPISTDRQRHCARALYDRLATLASFIESPEQTQEVHNTQYKAYWRESEAAYFHNVESSALTEEQIDTALTFEDATLVIAAAGSGKSSCIVGKIGFALKSGMFHEHEIIALAYNKEAATSLKKRLEQKLSKALGRPVFVASKTFHGFGLSILTEHYGGTYRPKVLKEDGGEEGRLMKTVIQNLLDTNESFQQALTLWFSLFPCDNPNPIGASGDLDECEKRYEECCRERLRLRRDPNRKPWEASIPTFSQSIYVRSLEERAIANWLILRGVAFEYERPDWAGAKRLGLGSYPSGKSKPYNPDFSYLYQERLPGGHIRAVRVIHEHFALNDQGKAPEWMGGSKYEERAAHKRAMYQKWMREPENLNERIVYFETTSAQVRDGSIWAYLEKSLQAAGVKVGNSDQNIQASALQQFREANHLEQLLINFVLLYKNSGYTEQQVREAAIRSVNPARAELFLDVAILIYHGYQEALREAGKIDYADMLRDAVNVLATGIVTSPYRFVLVDEFQDISHLKGDLVKSILNQSPHDSIVFCVGDDWQSINRFSGSDIDIFNNVDHYFGRYTSRLKLTRTFRCTQGIADVSRALVMQNSRQSTKEVNANASPLSSCVRVVHHPDSAENRRQVLQEELEHMCALGDQLDIVCPSVQILRRTKKDSTTTEGLTTAYLQTIRAQYAGRLSIEFNSVHAAKGSEADFVILPGLDSGFRGFPDDRALEPLLDLVLPSLGDSVEEERRLLYVGLTRARHAVSILTATSRPSEFVLELDHLRIQHQAIEWIGHEQTRIPCPRCHRGSLVKAPKSAFRICSKSNSCGYREKEQVQKAGRPLNIEIVD